MTTAVQSSQQAASEEKSHRMKIMIREAAALLVAGHLPALACLAPVRVLAPAPEVAEEEPDVPRNGYISAENAMTLNTPLGMMSWKMKR